MLVPCQLSINTLTVALKRSLIVARTHSSIVKRKPMSNVGFSCCGGTQQPDNINSAYPAFDEGVDRGCRGE